MGGQSSRLVKEIIEDSMYIIRQTDRQTYERTLSAHAEVQNKIQELEHIKKKMLDSKEQVAQRAQLYQAFENAGIHKKQLDQAVRIYFYLKM
jgi:hypothetical protein